jgi:ribosome-associated toxin RatA of RatAB toxin-antitoxin module
VKEITRSALVAQPPARLFSIISEVERYPDFVPGCKAARIEARSPHEVVAMLDVHRGALHAQFTTRNHLEPDRRVVMRLERGPFRQLEGEWLLTPIADQGTRVDLTMRFAFANALTGLLFERLFAETVSDLMDAFVARARSTAP